MSYTNYIGKRIAVTGTTGFIGGALSDRLEAMGARVLCIDGDITNPDTFSDINYKYDYIFHFAAPSSQMLFKANAEYCINTTIKGFMNAVEAAKKSGARLVYPSTGLLSQGKSNEYARCKQLCEDLARAAGIDALGLRIFATYGVGEGHKRNYASVPYLFASNMRNGDVVDVWGDGEQTRDFIYIDDTVNAIAELAENATEAIIDVGSGKAVNFNEIIRLLSKAIFDKDCEAAEWANYIEAPTNYVSETLADTRVMRKYYTPKVDMKKGLELMVKDIERLVELPNNTTEIGGKYTGG